MKMCGDATTSSVGSFTGLRSKRLGSGGNLPGRFYSSVEERAQPCRAIPRLRSSAKMRDQRIRPLAQPFDRRAVCMTRCPWPRGRAVRIYPPRDGL